MARPAFKKFITFPIIFLSLVMIFARGQEYKFRHLTTEDGLPVNFTWKVIRDSRGFLWITTRAGVCRYDGYNMTLYQYDPADSTSLSDNRINNTHTIAEDDRGHIWIGTMNGLNRFDEISGSFRRYRHDPDDPESISNNSILCVYNDRNGAIWIGTGWGSGLNRYHPDKDRFTVYTHNPGDTSWKIESIISLYEDHAGTFWVGAAGSLYQFDREKEVFSKVAFDPLLLKSGEPLLFKTIYEDNSGTMFFGTQNGFLTYDTTNQQLVPFEPLYNETFNLRFVSIQADPFRGDKLLWVGLGRLYTFDRNTSTLSWIKPDPVDPASIQGNVFKSFFIGESGMLWIAGTNGVNIMNPLENQIQIHHDFGSKYSDAMSFAEGRNGDIWIGTIYNLVHLDSTLKVIKVYDSLSITGGKTTFHGDIWQVYVDRENNVWMGNQVEGLYLKENGKDEFVHCTFSGTTGENMPVFIYEIYEDSQGILWVGTDPLGLYQRRTGDLSLTHFRNDSVSDLLKKTITLCVYEDRSGNLWFATVGDGLLRQPPQLRGTSKFLRYSHEPTDIQSLANNYVWSVCEDIHQDLWIATEKGLNRYIREDDWFESYTCESDPGSNFIYDLTGDYKGYLWMTTENGLIRFNPAVNSVREHKASDFAQIMPLRDIRAYQIFKNKEGRVFVCGAYNSGYGFYSFHPDNLKENTHIPPVAIVDFKVHNKPVKLDSSIFLKKHLVLRHNQNFFSFGFAALDYMEPENNQYAYKLEGLEDEWIYTGARRLANYTKVPPGKYVFRVKGSNNDGYWNEKGASIYLTVLPPPWMTWWAYVIYGLILAGSVFLIGGFYWKRLQLSHRLELEHLEAEKLKELDGMKSRFFANISHEFRTPLTLILGLLDKVSGNVREEETKNDIQVAQKNAGTLYRLINQLLSLSKLEMGQMKLHVRELDIIRMVNGYVQSFESLARQRGISLVFHADQPELKGYFDQDKIEKILYNLLSNAFKFTDTGGEIEVSTVQLSNLSVKCLIIKVSDTGTGIAPEHLPHIFDRFYQADDAASRRHEGTGIGLALTRELVELHHGTIHVESEEGKGSTFTVSLPLGKEYYKKEEMVSHEFPALENEPPGMEIITGDPVTVKRPESEIRVQKAEALPIVLIVEDNTDLREYIRGFLEKYYVILESGDGQAGFSLAIEAIPDLIISDIMMPVMDGYQLCQKLKTDERTSHIPVILLTARAGTESRIEGLETGVDDFITKPFDVDELLARIRNLIGLRKKLQERFMKNLLKLGLSHLSLMESGHLPSMDQQFLRKALKTVNENMSDPGFDVGKLSSGLALSRRQLHRKIIALTGNTPNRFIRSVRLSRAAEMLAAKTGTVTEIAFETGFNNLSYFAKSFREQYGVLPSEFHAENQM